MISEAALFRLLAEYEPDKKALSKYLDSFRAFRTMAEAIPFVYFEEDRRKVHSHQRRIGGVLGAVKRLLLENVEKLEACDTFEKLYERVDLITKKVRPFGPLAVYDTALRLGAVRNREPNVVFLHAGTRKGCRKLVEGKLGDTITKADLPYPVSDLSALDAENFLCIFKDCFDGDAAAAAHCGESGRKGVC